MINGVQGAGVGVVESANKTSFVIAGGEHNYTLLVGDVYRISGALRRQGVEDGI